MPMDGSSTVSQAERLDRGFERLARVVAMAGGVLLVGVVGMTVASIVGRYLFDAPIPGDYELTELACGIAVFAFFPYCQATNANVVVGFFTSRLRPRHQAALDSVHGIAAMVMAGVIAWRLLVGGIRKLEDGETTLFLEIPLHWAYFPALVAAGLLTAACFVGVLRHLRTLQR
ncbi:MAG: TRAP transporter small permease [Gammaproteobacteria bacterium]|nr:TRAP transporter small permease [Gammaproteobacteria bacterium]MYE86088.1 TRAP transporter small permease [Gammaproteobacteria bacterium]MYF12330.1 TRAP transporter small permease [Gammaproteobacteria bacterium]